MIPETSTTLLKNISTPDGSRWPEFVSRYRPMMLAYLKTHFPFVEADDMVQETLVALSKVMPRYRYEPDELGRFRNYLTGILRKMALKQCEKAAREQILKEEMRKSQEAVSGCGMADDAEAWREAVFEIATRQLLDDDLIQDRSKQIFQRLVVDGMSAEEVAAAYGTSRNNVDKTKSRMMARLREIVRALKVVGDV